MDRRIEWQEWLTLYSRLHIWFFSKRLSSRLACLISKTGHTHRQHRLSFEYEPFDYVRVVSTAPPPDRHLLGGSYPLRAGPFPTSITYVSPVLHSANIDSTLGRCRPLCWYVLRSSVCIGYFIATPKSDTKIFTPCRNPRCWRVLLNVLAKRLAFYSGIYRLA
jgi:hypothetical protein